MIYFPIYDYKPLPTTRSLRERFIHFLNNSEQCGNIYFIHFEELHEHKDHDEDKEFIKMYTLESEMLGSRGYRKNYIFGTETRIILNPIKTGKHKVKVHSSGGCFIVEDFEKLLTKDQQRELLKFKLDRQFKITDKNLRKFIKAIINRDRWKTDINFDWDENNTAFSVTMNNLLRQYREKYIDKLFNYVDEFNVY